MARVCSQCGFDAVEEGKPCGLCGEITLTGTTPFEQLATEVRPHTPGRSVAVPDYANGFLYADRYRIDDFLGRGGMGSVYRVSDTANGGTFALKILHSSSGSDEAGGTERFKREINILARLQHDAIPQIHHYGVRDGEMYFVCDFIDGRNLRVEARERGAYPPAEAAAIIARIADALDAAHRHGIVHRDVKPHNVMVSLNGTIYLLDFGVARGAGLDMKTITATGMIVGTPEYMSPEQFMGIRVDRRSDIYSLGVVLFELLTGKLPFTADTPIAIAMKHQTDTAPAPRSLRPEIPAWLDRVVTRCMSKRPEQRFLTASDLASELRRERTGSRREDHLPNGDSIVLDDSESEEWALVLGTKREKREWEPGMAFRFQDRYYRLDQTVAEPNGRGWVYRFSDWPEEEIFRGVVDYEQNAAQEASSEAGKLSTRLKGFFSREK